MARNKILTKAEIVKLLDSENRQRKTVFTNGCFDILHAGHVRYLEKARALGDMLVVGVNSDASVRALKGENRPINRLEDRMEVLAGLESVDYVVPFDEDTPANLIKAVKPSIHVKGGDYTAAGLPEEKAVREGGGKVVIVPFESGFSTSETLRKLSETKRPE